MASAPRIYICIRRTLDWHDESAVMTGLRPSFQPKFELWNATLDPPYQVFRHRLKLIAQANLTKVANAVQCPLEEVPRGAITVPVDDDDWLAPELGDRLAQEYDPAAKGYLWDRAVIEPPRRRTIRFGRWLWGWKPSTCASNNYAIPYEPGLVDVINGHITAGRYFDANAPQIKRIPHTLSIQNRNVSSQTAMAFRRPSITRDELVESVLRYRTLYVSFDLPHGLGWARPCVAQMDELMGQIRVK